MQKRLLNEVFYELKELGLVRSENDFSKLWLGKCDSYMRTLRFHNKPASMGAVAVCGIKLQHLVNLLNKSANRHPALNRLQELSDSCMSLVTLDGLNCTPMLNDEVADLTVEATADEAPSCQHDT